MTTSEWVSSLENESRSLDEAIKRSANNIKFKTKPPIHFETGTALSSFFGQRIVVTLNTYSGANTIASLEISTNAQLVYNVQRKVFSGGARWAITFFPGYDGSNYRPVDFDITVNTLVDGDVFVQEVSHG